MNLRKFTTCLISCGIMLTGIALSAVAAPPTFTVQAPKWSKLAVATTEGVNIRKTPSTTAPKLVYDESKIEEYDIPLSYYAYWSTAPVKGSVIAIPFEGPAPIVGELNGWYRIQNLGPNEASDGWVSAKFVKTATPVPMTLAGKLPSANFVWLNAPGNTADGVYGIYITLDEMNGVADFYFGRQSNGVVVCPYTLHCDDISMAENQKCAIINNGSHYTFQYNPSVLTEDYQIDMSKIGGDVLLQIIENATPAPEKIVCNYDNYIIAF